MKEHNKLISCALRDLGIARYLREAGKLDKYHHYVRRAGILRKKAYATFLFNKGVINRDIIVALNPTFFQERRSFG